MNNIPDFEIHSLGEISTEFKTRNINTFYEASNFVSALSYARNRDKYNLKSLFAENCGTCSTKHALLKTLALENDESRIKLFIGIFKMNAENTMEISKTLKRYNLAYVPEAHCYLKFDNNIFDYTKIDANANDFENDLLVEVEIFPDQITDYKTRFHRNFLKSWLAENPQIKYSIDELWKIREQCIFDLS